MVFQITVENAARSFPCRADQSVLAAMNAAFLSSIQTGCRSGGCGVCRIRVLDGEFETGAMSAAEVSPADRQKGILLACQVFPRSDLRLEALPRRYLSAGIDPAATRAMNPSPHGLIAGFQP